MIRVHSSGDFSETRAWLKRISIKDDQYHNLDRYGKMGVNALSSATPEDTGETAESWGYRIDVSDTKIEIVWYNTHIVDRQPIAVLIQYGHGTGTGGYVVGRDYINPAMRPLFDQMVNDIWKEVNR